jgi:uncharacterized protein YdhG (YjbR/CyaY superfamily)
MKIEQPEITTVDQYIALFTPDVQEVLEKVRAAIRKAAPDAEETIGYQMPAYKLHGALVYFAAAKAHVGFYPTPSGIEQFKSEISAYTWAKGSVQFPLDKPMPLGLIGRIVKFRVQENLDKAAAKGAKTAKGPVGQGHPLRLACRFAPGVLLNQYTSSDALPHCPQ